MVWYTTRERVMDSLDVKPSAYDTTNVDSAIESASRSVEGLLHRFFYPWEGTRYFDYPNDQDAGTGRLWLDGNEIVSISQVLSGGVSIAPADYFLEPVNYGPPFDCLDLNQASSASFNSGNTYQQSIAITGVFGYSADEQDGGTCIEALDATETQVDISGTPNIGVGSIIRIDTERMIVVNRTLLTSGQTLQASVGNRASENMLSVTNGAYFVVGEDILVDAERMAILDIAGNSLIVRRSTGSLAAHTSPTIYVYRTLTVERGALGTVAATHLINAPVAVHVVPGLVRELCTAYALTTYEQRKAGYNMTVGSGESQQESSGRGLKKIEQEARSRYGRVARIRAV
jgi:hypothetical protein